MVHDDVIENCLKEQYAPYKLFILLLVKTKKRFDKFLIKQMNMVEPQSLVIYEKLGWEKKGQYNISNISQYAYVVLFLKNLKVLLENDEVRQSMERPIDHQHDGIYRTVLDGSCYRENEFFRNHPDGFDHNIIL